ncbi:MAG: hypothetical protein WAV07_19280 [Candidatus Contendobacter sp.]
MTNKRSFLIAVAATTLVVLVVLAIFWLRKPPPPPPEPLVVAVANTQFGVPILVAARPPFSVAFPDAPALPAEKDAP